MKHFLTMTNTVISQNTEFSSCIALHYRCARLCAYYFILLPPALRKLKQTAVQNVSKEME